MTVPSGGPPNHRWSATHAADYVFDHLTGGPNSGESVRFGDRPESGYTARRSTGPSVKGVKVQASLARAFDTYAGLLQHVFASFASELTQVMDVQPGADQPTPVTLIGRPGSTAGAVVWLHNTSGGFVPEFTLRMTDLWRADGSYVSAELGSTDPHSFAASMESRRSAWLSVGVPAETTPGHYYGHLIAQGLPDVAVPVRLVAR